MADTREALVDALRAHVTASADGAYLTDWILIAAAAVPTDAHVTSYVTEWSDGPIHSRLGLVHYLSQRTDEMIARKP